MNQQQDITGKGFLQGLKKILFNDATPESSQSPQTSTVHHQEATISSPLTTTQYDGNTVKADIRQKILQLLDARNKQGIDFLEVWRAAQDMGGVSATNVKMAFTSLKHADPQLNKDRLVQTATAYITELETAFAQESAKREAERQALMQQRAQAQASLQNTIADLEKQIALLEQTLEAKKKEWQQLQKDHDPSLDSLDAKIRFGREAMNSVVDEIKKVVTIIQQELN
jgi:predicted  nucleic acid-binding Zn-ribbon protein